MHDPSQPVLDPFAGDAGHVTSDRSVILPMSWETVTKGPEKIKGNSGKWAAGDPAWGLAEIAMGAGGLLVMLMPPPAEKRSGKIATGCGRSGKISIGAVLRGSIRR